MFKKICASLINLSLVSAVAGISFNVFAQEEASTSGSSSPSESARTGKIAGVGAHLGWPVVPLIGLGFDAHYFINKNLLIGLSYESGTFDGKTNGTLKDDSFIEITKAEINVRLISLNVRYFVGNSFNLHGGIGQRYIGFDVGLRDKFTGDTASGKVENTSIVANFGIGNTWYWDNGFFIGGDWVGVSVPLSHSSKADISYSDPTIPSTSIEKERKDAEDIGKKLGKVTTVRLAVLNIGYAF